MKRRPLRKLLRCPTSHSENMGSSWEHARPIWKSNEEPPSGPRLNGPGDHPQVSHPQERRKAQSIVSNSEVFRLRPHGLYDVLIKRGSFFLENKTRHSTGRLQGQGWGGKRDLFAAVVSHVTQGNERPLGNVLCWTGGPGSPAVVWKMHTCAFRYDPRQCPVFTFPEGAQQP